MALSHTLGPTCILRINHNFDKNKSFIYLSKDHACGLKITHQKFMVQISKLIMYEHAIFHLHKVLDSKISLTILNSILTCNLSYILIVQLTLIDTIGVVLIFLESLIIVRSY